MQARPVLGLLGACAGFRSGMRRDRVCISAVWPPSSAHVRWQEYVFGFAWEELPGVDIKAKTEWAQAASATDLWEKARLGRHAEAFSGRIAAMLV